MKGKNILIGTGVYLVALWALYGTRTITIRTGSQYALSEQERAQMFGHDYDIMGGGYTGGGLIGGKLGKNVRR